MSPQHHDDHDADWRAALANLAYWERLAVRDGLGQPWRWFHRGPVRFYGAADRAALRQIEDHSVEAVFYHRTGDICRVRASTLEAFERLDMSVLRGTADWDDP